MIAKLSLFVLVCIMLSRQTSRAFACQSDDRLLRANSDEAGILVQGEIWKGNSVSGPLMVELIAVGGDMTRRTAPCRNGSFGFQGVARGQHELRVSDANGRLLYDMFVWLSRSAETLSIVLPEALGARAKPEAVSVQELRHKSPRKAMAEFRKGSAALEKQQTIAALDHLKAAVALDPGFADAHNDLGVAYERLKEYQKAAEQFEQAISLAPGHPLANDNLCILLVRMNTL